MADVMKLANIEWQNLLGDAAFLPLLDDVTRDPADARGLDVEGSEGRALSVAARAKGMDQAGSAFEADVGGAVGAPGLSASALRIFDIAAPESFFASSIIPHVRAGDLTADLLADAFDFGIGTLFGQGGFGRGGAGGYVDKVPTGIEWEDGTLIFHGSHGDDWMDWSDIGVPVIMYGYGGIDVLHGGDQDDRLYAGGGSWNFLHGHAGNDLLVGGSGNDIMSGDDGNDVIHDGAGTDAIALGAGNDALYLSDDGEADQIFIFGTFGGTVAASGVDLIDGFVTGVDKLSMEESEFVDFNDFMDAVTYFGAGNALLDLGDGNGVIFTNLSGGFGWEDVTGLG